MKFVEPEDVTLLQLQRINIKFFRDLIESFRNTNNNLFQYLSKNNYDTINRSQGFRKYNRFYLNYSPISSSSISTNNFLVGNTYKVAGQDEYMQLLSTDSLDELYVNGNKPQLSLNLLEPWLPQKGDAVECSYINFESGLPQKSSFTSRGFFRGYWIPEEDDPLHQQRVHYAIDGTTRKFNLIKTFKM